MSKCIRNIGVCLVVVAYAGILGGCGSAQKTTPHMGFGKLEIQAQFTRDDLVVLERVEGSSTLTSILLGAINIIDGDKLQLLGIKFFKDKYTYFAGNDTSWVRCADRAYYKALEAAPEADAVFVKAMDHEAGGLPLLFSTEAVTLRGKAVKLKADQ